MGWGILSVTQAPQQTNIRIDIRMKVPDGASVNEWIDLETTAKNWADYAPRVRGPNLFNVYVNDKIVVVEELKYEVSLGEDTVSGLINWCSPMISWDYHKHSKHRINT